MPCDTGYGRVGSPIWPAACRPARSPSRLRRRGGCWTDAGIGGEAAEAVARKIRQLADHHQVLCITHLPQIAARGTLHFQVSKKVGDGRTQSAVVRLSSEARVQELVRMLAGDSATEQTQAWAEELLVKGGACA